MIHTVGVYAKIRGVGMQWIAKIIYNLAVYQF